MSMQSGDGRTASRSTISDSDLLAVVFQLGLRADPGAILRALNARAGTQLRLDHIERRMRRLHEDGLLQLAPGGAGDDMHVCLFGGTAARGGQAIDATRVGIPGTKAVRHPHPWMVSQLKPSANAE